MNRNKKEITEKDMELIERKIDAINIKMINWKHEILNTMFKTRNVLLVTFVIFIIGLIVALLI